MPSKKQYTTSPKNYIAEIRADVKELKTYLQLNTVSTNSLERRYSYLLDEFKLLRKQINQQEQKFESWRSEIHDLIDLGFTTKAKNLDEEVDILNTRTADLRQRTEKLEDHVFASVS